MLTVTVAIATHVNFYRYAGLTVSITVKGIATHVNFYRYADRYCCHWYACQLLPLCWPLLLPLLRKSTFTVMLTITVAIKHSTWYSYIHVKTAAQSMVYTVSLGISLPCLYIGRLYRRASIFVMKKLLWKTVRVGTVSSIS